MISLPSFLPTFISPIAETRQLLQPSVKLFRPGQNPDAAAGLFDFLKKRTRELQFVHDVMLTLAPAFRAQIAKFFRVADVDHAKPWVALAEAEADFSLAALQMDDMQLPAAAGVEDVFENVREKLARLIWREQPLDIRKEAVKYRTATRNQSIPAFQEFLKAAFRIRCGWK
jgi:hypothetical protein